MVRAPGVLTILTSKSLSRHSVVQILAASWAAGPLRPPVFLGGDDALKPLNDDKKLMHSISGGLTYFLRNGFITYAILIVY